MTNFASLLEQFAQHLANPDAQIPLAATALLVAQCEYPAIKTDAYLTVLEGYASDISSKIGNENDPLYTINTLSQHLFDDLGFNGNSENYYDPENSYLNKVLDRRLGIPITLSLLYLDIGSRLNIPLLGIGMPGHFLVRHRDINDLYVDAFHNGILLSEQECQERVESITGYIGPWREDFLQPISNRDLIGRMLRNLHSIYEQQQDRERIYKIRSFMNLLTQM